MTGRVACETCGLEMHFVRQLTFDGVVFSYVTYHCSSCDTTRVISADDKTADEYSEKARMSLEIVRILQTMTLAGVRRVTVELEAKLRLLN